jgi:hypothetical protein
MKWKYLHKVGHYVSWIEHRITPDVRAVLTAMMSRIPEGGIEARYRQLVEAVAKEKFQNALGKSISWDELLSQQEKGSSLLINAEDALCEYPLPKVIRNPNFNPSTYDKKTGMDANGEKPGFYDEHVSMYGHSSPLELTGSPTVFIEHISWWLAYLTFDSPLVRGQEMSTRAIWRKDWAPAGDCCIKEPSGEYIRCGKAGEHHISLEVEMKDMHRLGLEIAWHEVQAQKEERAKKCPQCGGLGFLPIDVIPTDEFDETCKRCQGTGQKHLDYDPQGAFRWAFDQARWALPGTIETGVAHTADMRTMSRVIKVMEDLAEVSGQKSALGIIEEIKEAYRQAMPGMADLGLRESVYTDSDSPEERTIPGHILFPMTPQPALQIGTEAETGQTVYLHPDPTKGKVTTKSNFAKVNAFTFAEDSEDVHVAVNNAENRGALLLQAGPYQRKNQRSYVDPYFNHFASVDEDIRGSLACARDWHRHRTFYPFILRIVVDDYRLFGTIDPKDINNEGLRVWGEVGVLHGKNGPAYGFDITKHLIKIDHHYEAISEFGKANYIKYLTMCSFLVKKYLEEENQWMAMLCLPLGTRVLMKGQGGLRDAIYKNELRSLTKGANFEYKEHATEILNRISAGLPADVRNLCALPEPMKEQ